MKNGYNNLGDSNSKVINNENLYARCERYKEKYLNSRKNKKITKKIKRLNEEINKLQKEKNHIKEQKTLII